MMKDEDTCPICVEGIIETTESSCTFCNGTGEYTSAAGSYMKNHICQCILNDRKNCPICGKKCHHNTPNKPKVLISPSM